MATDPIWQPGSDTIARNISGEMVLMHLDSGMYFGLNAVGARVWELLAAEPLTAGAITDTLAAEFDAPRETIAGDVEALLGELAQHALIAPSDRQ